MGEEYKLSQPEGASKMGTGSGRSEKTFLVQTSELFYFLNLPGPNASFYYVLTAQVFIFSGQMTV